MEETKEDKTMDVDEYRDEIEIARANVKKSRDDIVEYHKRIRKSMNYENVV